MTWPAKILTSRDGLAVNAQANYAIGGKEDMIYPSDKSEKGLDAAKAGSIIVFQEPVGNELTKPEDSVGQYKRPWMAAFVESVNPSTKCLTVSTKNNPSVLMDACGNSENLGHESEFEICHASYSGGTYEHSSGTMPDCAKNNEYYSCKDSQWDKWTVFNPYGDSTGGKI